MRSILDKIVDWVTVRQDSEFCMSEGHWRPARHDWLNNGRPCLFCTKTRSFLDRVKDPTALDSVNVTGAYGIPAFNRMAWLRTHAKNIRFQFFGDLDGVDLMTYAALADGLGGERMEYLGISDKLLSEFSLSIDAIDDNYFIGATHDEQEAIGLLTEWGVPVRELVGERCHACLMSGRKLEIEGLLWKLSADELLEWVAAQTG